MFNKKVSYSDTGALEELFVGKSVVHVKEDRLTLNDGTVVKVLPNSGCWGCVSGNFHLTERLQKVESVITNVQLKNKLDSEGEKVYTLFVYTGGKKNKKGKKKSLIEVSGQDGNGFYGTGFELEIIPVN